MLLLLACWAPTPTPSSDVLGSLPADTDAPWPERTEIEDAPYVDTAPPVEDPPAPRLLLNEAMSRNASTWQVEGALPDWVELYNADTAAMTLDDVTLTDGSGRVWMGREGVIEPGARLVLFADGAEGELHAPFQLDGDGDELELAVQGAVTDRLTLGELDDDVAWARHPDAGYWAPTLDATPDEPNLAAPSATLDPTDGVYQIEAFHTVEITLTESAVSSLRADRLTYVEGVVTVDGIAFPSVGVRLKAYVGSSRTIDQKCGFKVDLNRYEDREWQGVETLTLNNMVQDYTYIHEYMAYELFRAVGIATPRVGYARVYVNGEDYGVYLLVETVDDRFVDRWFTPGGPLYEGAYGVDLMSGYEWSFELDEGPVTDRSELTEIITILNGSPTDEAMSALEELVDMDALITNMAVESLILHWDGYTTRNNYRLYQDPHTGRFTIIPWGADQTFLTLYYYPWSGYGTLFTFCLANEACAARYDAKLLEVAEVMKGLDLAGQGAELHEWLLPEITDDPRREFGWDTHMYYYGLTLSTIGTWPDTVIGLVEAR